MGGGPTLVLITTCALAAIAKPVISKKAKMIFFIKIYLFNSCIGKFDAMNDFDKKNLRLTYFITFIFMGSIPDIFPHGADNQKSAPF